MFCNFFDVWLRNVRGCLNQFFLNAKSVAMLQNAGCQHDVCCSEFPVPVVDILFMTRTS
jgi:hypothetical protein